jgi:hypothetical protein
MAMNSSGLADKIKSKTENMDTPEKANNALWEAICEYVEANAEVVYQWAAVDPSGFPDPTITWTGTIITGGSLFPNGMTTPETALSRLSSDMNANVMTWTVKPAPGFATSGPTITGPTINIKMSGAEDRDSALESLSSDIIEGIRAAIPPTHSGIHGAYTGATTSGVIL